MIKQVWELILLNLLSLQEVVNLIELFLEIPLYHFSGGGGGI